MHFRHRQTDRQTDTDIVAYARDVYITSRAKKQKKRTHALTGQQCEAPKFLPGPWRQVELPPRAEFSKPARSRTGNIVDN